MVVFRSSIWLMLVLPVTGCLQSPDQPADDMIAPILPVEVAGWMAAGDSESYDTESIFAYIDGHAEVYLAYGMQRCVSRRYRPADGDAEIVVEGSWYGSVYATGGSEDARQAVLDVGAAVADALESGGDVPSLVTRMPSSGLDRTSVCYLRSPQILNAHVYVGGDNLFGLVPGVEAVVGKYDRGETAVYLILVRYLDEATAETVESRVRAEKSGGGGRPAMVIGRNGELLAAIVGAGSDDGVDELLEEALGGGA